MFFAGRKGSPARPSLLYYDARCSFCVSLARWLRRLDLFRTLELRSTLDTTARQAGLDQTNLDRAAWLVTPAGVAYQGFYAFRKLALRLPPLWPAAPLLWLPGMSFWGVRLYRWVADHRGSISGCQPSESGMKSISPPL
jgi:predicted DCC family thiol-disulfide oxidoreductase YuxK